VGYSGVKADTVVLVKQVAKLKPQKLFLESAKIVKQARPALEQGHWAEAGELMNKSQEILRRIGVSTPKLERLIDASLKAGAWGVKLSGAGGGDCMIALTPPARRRAIEQAITQAGGEVLRVKLAL
ncbi:MAG TPA: mevalonate kinase, partial [Patescibacteria group bacterium]|nr:mevalonate kinase [Patescibacteria group bacterium]